MATRPVTIRALLVALLVALLGTAAAPARAQRDPALEILQAMSPAERVGQLFIVSYVGEEVGSGSDIDRFVTEHHVGGVVLLSANQNFYNDADAPVMVRERVATLQQRAMADGGVPLLVAIDQEGDGWPYTRLTGGMSPLPSPMAVGATWEPELARQVGEVTGRELAALGINLLLGPDVDVLNTPRSTSKGDLGTRVFGGDPYWVGQMGRAYIRGVHEGSAGRIATVAKHFPGHGGSDRLPDDEVATVDKSLQELGRIELPPFYAITRAEIPGDPSVTEALMSSHIRYRGFQGNIRQFTAPLSFDPQGLRTILDAEEFDAWRRSGVMVSDSLGVPAVKRYFDPTGESFPHRQIARDALMAGNDLLVLAQYALVDAWEPQRANMEDTLAFFREQYEADRIFAERVDDAAHRVIRLKLGLYPELADGGGLPPLPEARLGEGVAVTEAVAEAALTLLFPRSLDDLAERLPRAPRRGEPIVIFTDARRVRDCFDCPFYQPLPTDALERAILARYGPEGTDQITDQQIISFSFEDLKLFLGVPDALEESGDPAAAEVRAGQVRALVENASWILLVMQDINLSPVAGSQRPRFPNSDAARWLLDAAAGSLFDKKVVAFAFNVPYQLDTTEVSKLTAAYALYSKQAPFVDVAARVLFQEVVPHGAPPVTVEAINYDLPTQLEPAPEQPLAVERVSQGPLIAPTRVEVASAVILDRNGNPVPDGTSVEFVGLWRGDPEAPAPRVGSVTEGGVATATIPLEIEGILELRAEAVQARSERPLVIAVGGPTPTPSPTSEPSPTAEASVTPLPIAAGAPADGAGTTVTAPFVEPADTLTIVHLLASLLGSGLGVASAWRLARTRPMVSRVRHALLALIGGSGAYLVWGALGAVGGAPGALGIALAGALGGVALARVGRRARSLSGSLPAAR